MQSFQILSRRRSDAKVDFRPDDPSGDSPFAQLRRFARALQANVMPANDFDGMDDVLDAYEEFLFRKIFTGTTHQEYLDTPPETRQWLIAIAATDNEVFRNKRTNEKR